MKAETLVPDSLTLGTPEQQIYPHTHFHKLFGSGRLKLLNSRLAFELRFLLQSCEGPIVSRFIPVNTVSLLIFQPVNLDCAVLRTNS